MKRTDALLSLANKFTSTNSNAVSRATISLDEFEALCSMDTIWYITRVTDGHAEAYYFDSREAAILHFYNDEDSFVTEDSVGSFECINFSGTVMSLKDVKEYIE